MENIIEKVRRFVEDECRKPTSKYGYEAYNFHLCQWSDMPKN